ncbi:ATP-binding protein [Nonomuraea roseoviolacea]|uniref:Transcriptional regulator with XRE-family HTH domain/tetratricopeptide (TPR) repeat protein n=1 Tax=Nonomuraea roseoviolacea subsp. carminata TaxID=160689 RepID=A0ABT1KE48_9ACTN|nr:helix-turn-helix domain-containing protein [Nonomuraea roseoviolacea]MCP2352288.1 transcriptional regulator with XRE-family HTH domain/tetratricopeptide (TPR) repeat protein [Nonomuraea roseoviolacea subsp. carminata]
MEDAYGILLRRHRLRLHLTQEALAERAGMSSRSIAEMERSPARGPRPRSVEQLAAALGLTGAEREEFVEAGRALFWASRAGREPRDPSASAPAPGRARPAAPAARRERAREDGARARGDHADTSAGAGAPGAVRGEGTYGGEGHDGQAYGGERHGGQAYGGAVPPPPRQLPADLPDFVGRGEELAVLRSVLDPAGHRARLAVVSGPPGVGKSALAVHAGHALASRFPDGLLYAALRGTSADPADPAEVLAQLLRVLGVAGAALPAGLDARGGLFRDRTAGRRVLLLLDDAGGYRQVEPLLPAKDVAVLVTSRLPLTALPGVTSIDLRPLPDPTAVELLCRVAGSERVRAEPVATAELVSACGGLPLAVRIVGARLAARPHWTAETLNLRLADERRRLDELCHGDLAVRPVLHLARQALSPAAARAFALLGEPDMPSFPEWAVAAFLGTEPASGAAVLEELLDARLLESLGPDQAGQPRYRFNEVTRLYARERRQAEIGAAEWKDALARAAGGWLALARRARDRLHCLRLHLDDRAVPAAVVDPAAAVVAAARPIEWFEAEREALAAVGGACAELGLAALARCLAGCCADFHELRAYYDDWRRATQSAHAACRRAGDRAGEAAMLRGLGTCLVELDDTDAAATALTAARDLSEEVGDVGGAAMASGEMGLLLSLMGRLDRAEAELRHAVERLGRAGLPLAKATALTSLGFLLRQRGETAMAVDVVRSALGIARSCGDPFAEAYVLRGLAGALLAHGRPGEAEGAARQAAILFDRVGDPIGTAQSLRSLGEALAQLPAPPSAASWAASPLLAEAKAALAAAAAVFRQRGHRWGLALTELSLGEIEARQGLPEAAPRLRRSLRYWTTEQVPALRARTLVALASAAENDGDPAACDLLRQAYGLYLELASPVAADLAARLGIPGGTRPRS